MPRPCCMRYVGCRPNANAFKPVGVPLQNLATVKLALDEVEALRLADLEGLYQEQAAERMKISRPTFARIVESARKKTADALIHGKAILLEGGPVVMKGEQDMPNRDGTGPVGKGAGRGQGPCGCGQRRGWTGERRAGRGFGRRGCQTGPSRTVNESSSTESASEKNEGKPS